MLREVERVVREEMNAIGGQEILLPALLPRDPYEASNRWTEYGPNLFRLKDRKGNDYMLGPTHEELFALTVKGEYNSYKDFPVTLYQVQTKYRDEERPRAGILRGREFLMKDSYSFDLTDEGLTESYQAHRGAYEKIFTRLGVKYVIVSATSGAMGGSASEEFLAESEIGEDTYVRCLESGYAANVEAVKTVVPDSIPFDGLPEAKVYDTANTPTIDTLVDWANGADLGRTVTAADTLKNIMVKTRLPGGEWELLGIGIPGDREVDEKRLEASLEPAEFVMITETDFKNNPFLAKGYIGPKALQANGVRYLVDPRVVDGTSWITGATKTASTWSASLPVATSPLTEPSKPPRFVTATPLPMEPARWSRLAVSRSGTSSNSAASTPTSSPSTSSPRTASPSARPWVRTASASRVWWPSLPSSTMTRRVCVGPLRSHRPTFTSSLRTRTRPLAKAPKASPRSSTARDSK